jgi:hypothetical protein
MIAYRDYPMISLGGGGTLGVFAVLDGGVVSRQMAVVPGISERARSFGADSE